MAIEDTTDYSQMNAQEVIVSAATAIIALNTEIEDIKNDKKSILQEAKRAGLNPSLLNKAIQLLTKDPDPQGEAELALYKELIEPLV